MSLCNCVAVESFSSFVFMRTRKCVEIFMFICGKFCLSVCNNLKFGLFMFLVNLK